MLLCERCNKNEATIQLVKGNGNGKESIMLCDKCAVKMMNLSLEDEMALDDFLVDLNTYIETTESLIDIDEERCRICGTESCDFESSKLLGCEKCYESLIIKICDYFKWSKTGIKHKGKIPKSQKLYSKSSEILMLEEKLKLNIINEEYEEAIITKEKINDLKKSIEEDSNNGSMDKSSE